MCNVLGSSDNTHFCVDGWIGDKLLMHLYPSLLIFEQSKHILLHECFTIHHQTVIWSRRLKRELVTTHERGEFANLTTRVFGASPNNLKDSWQWCNEGESNFSTARIKNVIQCGTGDGSEWKFIWNR